MDYDDNDFQSQNFHLGCEDNTKFPPSSPSYTLPKYDLDENLQVHLGFDIDEEVLLGIQCQQDNHWIEDFSRGSSRIEFSPSAADSCSISRHNNVWSEATSSESVEMLLKSVGQDDGANKQTFMEEQDACDGFGNLNDQMDSSLNTDRTLPCVPGDFIDTGPAVPPDKFVESLPGPSKDASGELARGECTLETRKDVESGSESMIPVNLISPEKCSLDPKVTFWTNSLGDGSMEKSEGDGHHSSAEMVVSCNQENIVVERVQLDSCSTSEPSLGSDAVELNCKKLSQQVTTDKLGRPVEVYPPEEGNPILSSDAHMKVESNIHQVRSEISCPNTEESSHIVRNMQETYILGTKGDKIFEGCLTHSDAHHVFSVPDAPKGVDQIEGKEVFLSVTENKQHFEGKNSSDGEGSLPSSVVNVSTPADLTTGKVLNTNDGHDRLGTNPAKTTSWKLESRVLVDKVPEIDVCIPDIGLSVPDQPSDVNNVEGCRAFHPDNMEIDSVPETVESDVTKLASSNKMEGVSQLPTGNRQAMNLVEKQEAGRPSLPVSDIVNFDSEEAADESSLELGSSISVSQAESEQHTVTVCSSSVGVPSYTATQSASLAEKSISIKSNDDPQVSMARTGAKEDRKELSGDSTIHTSEQLLVFNVKQHEAGIPSFIMSDLNLDEKEEPVDGICTKLGSSVSFSNVEMEQHTICSTVIDLPSDITVFSSALVENSPNNKYNNELQVSMSSTAAQESGKDLSEDSTIHSSVQQLVSDVEKPEAGIPSLPVSDIVYLDKKEELVDGASTELVVSVSKAETEQCTICSTALALPSDTTAQSSAVAEKSLSIKFNDEPQLSMSTTAAQVYGKELSGNSIIGASVEQLVSDFEKQGAGIPSSPVSDIVNFDKEEPVDGISTELGSSMSVSMPETEQHRVCTAFDLPYDAAAQSSALAEKSLSIKLNNEQVPTTTATAQGYGKELFGDSTIHNSVQQLVVDVEKQKTTIPSLPVSDIVNFDKEEPVGISTEFGSLVSVSMAETEQHTVCSTALDLASHTAAKSSAFEEISIKSNEEPQVSMALTAAQEYDIANYDKKHEPTDGISRELASSGSVSKAETVQHAVSTTALNLPSDTTGQSSALAERSLTIKSNADPEVSVAIPAAQESGDLIIHASISLLQEKDDYESTTSSLRAEAASIGDIPAESVPSSAHESSQGDEVNKCEEKSSSPLAENVIEQNTLEAVSGPSSTEPNCGSPTVISSKEQSQTAEDYHEDNGKSIVQNDPDDLPRVPTAIDGQTDIVKSTANVVSESFTFEVGSLADLSQRETTNGWKTFSNIHPSGLHQTEEVSPTASGACQTDSGLFEETRHESRQVSNEKPVHVMPDKMRDKNTVASGGTSPKGTSTKAKSAKKSSQIHKAEKAANISSPAPNFSGSFSRAMQMEELRQYPLIDGSTKQPAGPPVQTTNLPDLNSLASPVLFRQPFTDLQQVQLRAQIFVYGSLIQSAAPDEACMKSAFADSGRDSERTMWESTWRVAVERCYSQKSPLSNLETPVHSHLGSRISEQVSRSDTLHGKPLRSPAGKSSCKSETPPVLNPTMSLSSPLWSIATPSRDALHPSSVPRVSVLDPQQSPSPLSPYQSSQMRQYMGNTTPWLSQVAAPGPPWVFSPQNSTLDVGIPGTESVQVTPMRDILVPCTTSVHLASPSLLASTVGPMNVLPGQAVLMDVKNTISAPSEEPSSGGQKSRKRKKNPSPQEVIQMLQVTHPGAASTPATKHLSTSAGTLASHTSSKISDGNFVATSSPVVPSSHFQIISGGGDTCQRVILPEEISSRVELAKLYQEDAASFAASAVRHCQGIWSQLSIQKKSGLVSCDEAKLASAAVAAAAAASVAKAAAEAAKLASNAALQAKLMADEVLRIGMLGPDTIFPDAGVSFRKATPASNLKGKEKANSSSSLIVAAREAAKRRVISASAASKQAENLEAIVKAAEIAVEAVAQAGAVIAMGDPVPLKLNELLDLGLDGYWKLQQVTAGHKEEGIAKAGEGRHKMISERPSNKKDTKENTEKQSPSKVVSKQSEEVLHGLVNGISRESGTSERTLEQHKGCKQSDLAKNIGVVLESEIGSRETIFTSQNDEGERDENTGKSAENGIQEGSVVEVFTDEDGLRGVWFSAKVLNVKDGKAFICYDELLEEEGSEHIKEWVPLEGEADKPPRIRPAHPLTPAMKYEGTRKRRRAAIGNYAWSVGDRVDVWMRDGWWEAIVSEKDKDDDTKLTVRFPAEGGSSSAVRLWSLRPSLIWKHGQWIDWPRENNFCLDKSDMPQEKRQKFGRHEVGTDSQTEEQLAELSKDMGVEESWSQMLSTKDRIFTVGKNAVEEAPKVKRTGLQQEGSKVIFGVPKPGKKRKFMEVSKHYDADEARNKASEGADSMKLMKYLMPQGSCRGWRNTPKVDFRGKQMSDPKPKVLRPKAQTILSKSVIEKDSSTASVQDPLANAKSLVGREESNSGKQKLPEVGSSSNNIRASEPEGPVLASSNAPSFKKSSAVVTEKGVKGKLGPAGGKLAIDAEGSGTNDHAGKPVSESIEPRRSNRRIQPTSRLLEGLQSSSLVVSKLPPLSHDKDTKARQRSGSSSRGSHG